MTEMPRQRFKYLENEKSFKDETKSVFHHFERVFIKVNKTKFFANIFWGKDVKDVCKTLNRDDEEYNAGKLNNYFKPNINMTCKWYVSEQTKQSKDKKYD